MIIIERWYLTSVASVVKRIVRNEHRVLAIGGGHSKLIAGKHIPASTVKLSSAISVGDIVTRGLALVVEVNISSSFDTCEYQLLSGSQISKSALLVFLRGRSRVRNILELIASSVDWVGRHGVEEGSGVRVVCHSHVREAVHQESVEAVDIVSGVDLLASIEDSAQCAVVSRFNASQISPTLLDDQGAVRVRILVVLSDDVSEGVLRSGGVLEVEDGS
jgi:hypothetical protein